MKQFRDRVAVVTGAASGIGLALCERFAAEGMRIVLADVEANALQAATEKLARGGAKTLAAVTDVTRPESVDALAARAFEAFGAVHVVCNNAGVGGDAVPCWEQSLANWKWVLDVNLWGVIHGIRSFVPRMLKHGDEGHVVNTASMAGHISVPMFSPYHASKFAVVTLSETLHFELALVGARLKASVLCPGFVKTRIMESERNRPAALQTPGREISEGERNFLSAYQEFVGAGIPPADVAARVLDAIRDERFWVFPHPEALDSVRTRTESVLAQQNPVFAPPGDMKQRLGM
jgi:NAD(P)-dependent dehydrogenase (short-subunit alcohol dehydrogenase family)